jgi:hypothetical protein
MPKRGASRGTSVRGAARSRSPVLTLVARRRPTLRPSTSSPRDAGDPATAPTLHDLVVAPPDGAAPLTVDELLTGWLSSLHRAVEPETYAEFNDYAKHVERMCRVQHVADCICRELDTRIAGWVSGERSTGTKPRRKAAPRD